MDISLLIRISDWMVCLCFQNCIDDLCLSLHPLMSFFQLSPNINLERRFISPNRSFLSLRS
ncbi:hypothetical protein HanRHA438_Chr13g0627961 [Helianthus annuus]|nr:hypothetical protein HanRHA438_Chr13g0627961 [Helianthus annuus]